MEMILDTQIAEHRNKIMLRAKQIHEQEDLSIEEIEGLLRRSAEVIDNLRDYCFAKDREVEYWQEKHKLEGEAMGSEIQREVNKSRCLNDALQISKAEVVRLRAENNELAQDKEAYRQMVQHFVDEH
jgi:hypothetical protein